MSTNTNITVTLSDDGMGPDATAADFDSWVAYVCDHIDERTGYDVNVERARRGELLSRSVVVRTDMRGDDSQIVQNVADAVDALWEEWCAGGAAS